MTHLLKHAAMTFVDTILPPRCVISGDIVDHQGMVAPHIWENLGFIRDPYCESCGFPFEYEVEEGSLCAACLDYPPRYDSARAALKYDDASRDLVLGFKHADKTHAAKVFTPWLSMVAREMTARADVIIPVPLHRLRLIKRRYNQAAIMAHYFAKETGLPALNDALLRVRATPPQGHMDISARRKNVRKAFAVNLKRAGALKGSNVVLMDDVYTTGATVNECAKALKKAGANEVHILTLARVVRDGFG